MSDKEGKRDNLAAASDFSRQDLARVRFLCVNERYFQSKRLVVWLVPPMCQDRGPRRRSSGVRARLTQGSQPRVLKEHELLNVVGAMPSPRKSLEIRDALSLAALRNYVRYLTIAINVGLAAGMQVKSAIPEPARLVQEAGGGRFEFQISLHDRLISLQITRTNIGHAEGIFGPFPPGVTVFIV